MNTWFLITIITSLGVFTFSAADELLDFSSARKIILSRNTGLKSVQSETEAATAGVAQAGTFPNPSAGLSLDKFGANEIEISVEQTFELGDKRKYRTEAAQKDVEAVINNGNLTRLELEAEIIRRFIPIAVTESKLAVVDSILKITELTKDQIKRRVDAGGAKLTDLIRIEIDIEQLQLEHEELLKENQQARVKFAALGGEHDSALKQVTGELDHNSAIPDLSSIRKSIKENPVLTAYTIEQARLQTERKLLRSEAIPDLILSAGYLRDNADNSNSPIFGVSMSLPLFNKNNAAQKQIELRCKSIGEQRENALRLLTADIEEIHSKLIMTDQKLQSLQSSTIPKAQRVYEMLQEYYNAGNAGFLDLTGAQAEMLQLKLLMIDLQQTRALALADLMQRSAATIQIVK